MVKTRTPCGIALGNSISQALKRAIEADSESAFGGVVILNSKLDKEAGKIISSFKLDKRGNIDLVASPSIDDEVLSMLCLVRKSMGIYTFGKVRRRSDRYNIKWIDGGFILQTKDENIEKSFSKWQVVTKIFPTKLEMRQMQVAWKFITRIRSNTIIVMDRKLPMTRGIGSGQTSRVRAVKIALEQAGKHAKGAILASDSFFPFTDSLLLAEKYGISAIVQQGGSIRDKEVIKAANKAKIAMIFTNRRAFWH